MKQNQEKAVEMIVLKTFTIHQLIQLFLEETDSKLNTISYKIYFQYIIKILNNPLHLKIT